MRLRYGLMFATALVLGACHSERGWIRPSNDAENRLVEAARNQNAENNWAFGQALVRARVLYIFVRELPADGQPSMAVWTVPGRYGQELAIYTSKERLAQSPHAAAGAAPWVGQSGRDLLKMAAKEHEGVVVNAGLLPRIEIAPSEVEVLLANTPEEAPKSSPPHS